jgi:type I restriction enzyme, S subunit
MQVEPVKLGNVVSFKTGKLDSNAATPDGEYPFFTCSQETLRTNTFSFDTECVLLAGNNANGIYPLKFYKGKFDVYQRTYVIRSLDTETLNNRYLYYVLILKLDYLRTISTGASTMFLTLTILKGLDLLLPSLPIQERIVAILSAYDDLIENNQRRIRLLEEMAATVYREWFMHFRFPGHEAVPMIDGIPAGWERKELGDIAQENRRGVNPNDIDPETPYFGLEHLPRKSIALAEWGAAQEVQSSKFVFFKNEILFGKIRPYFHKVGVAPIDGVCSSDTIVISPKAPELFSITLCSVSSDEFVAQAMQTSHGTKMPRANWGVLVKFPVTIPPAQVLSRFNGLIEDIVAQIQNLVFRCRNLRQTRDLLLPKLISGELDVEHLDINTANLDT